MSTIVIKTIRGRRYAYEHRTWRDGKRVRSETRYLGPVDGPQRRPKHGGGVTRRATNHAARDDEARMAAALERYAHRIDADQRARYGETAGERQERERHDHLADLHERFGLRVDPVPPAPAPPSAPRSAEESPSDDAEGQGTALDGPSPEMGDAQNS